MKCLPSTRTAGLFITILLLCTGCATKEQKVDQGTHEMTGGGTWVGKIIDGKPFGWGTYTWSNGNVYEGFFTTSGRSGSGTEIFSSGAKYVGEFLHNKRTVGMFSWPNGDSWSGGFEDNQPHGAGVYAWKDGSEYKGAMRNGKLHGNGTYTDSSGNIFDKTYDNGEAVYTKAYNSEPATYKGQENSLNPSVNTENQSLKNHRIDHYKLEFNCRFDPGFGDPFLAGKSGELLIDSERDTLALIYDRKDKRRMAFWNSFRKVGQSYFGEEFLTNKSSKFTLDAKSGKATYERGEMKNNKLRFLEMYCIQK